MDSSYVKRFFEEPSQSYFLFGPRGTGKSTMARERHGNAFILDLRIPELRFRFLSHPSFLKELVHAQPEGQTIGIHEVQKIPELLSVVHSLIEEKRKWKFVLTCSSARKLKQQGVDLLGGRALKKVLHPCMAAELKQTFDFQEALLYGLLPLRFQHQNPPDFLKAYICLYLEEEIRAEGLIRNLDSFARFLQTMSFSHGSILNRANISKECGLNRATVNEWIQILKDLLICYEVPVFTERAKRHVTVHPKFYFIDCGVYRALRPQSVKDPISELEGAALEGLVMQHLKAWCDYSSLKHTLYFWRTRSGVEVDFVVQGPSGFWAVEVKNTGTIRPKDIRSLRSFKEDYPEAQLVFSIGVTKSFYVIMFFVCPVMNF